MKRKALSALMAFIIVLSSIDMTAFAATNNEKESVSIDTFSSSNLSDETEEENVSESANDSEDEEESVIDEGTKESESIEESIIEEESGLNSDEEIIDEFADPIEETIEKESEETILLGESDDIVSSGSCGDNATYTLDEDGKLVISGTGSIARKAFYSRKDIKTLVINPGLTIIEYDAFHNCSNLTSIELPEGIKSIGDSAFYDCSSLTSIELPEELTSIGSKAFYNCSMVTSIELPKGLTTIGFSVFANCNSLMGIDIPNGVTSIGSSAFYNCSSLTSIDIPEGVTSIGDSAFSGCSGLTSIELPEGITYISNGAFYDCSNLTSIDIPEGVKSIGREAFYNCSSLTSIRIPESLTGVDFEAFEGCSGIKTDSAFYGCSSLTSIKIPESLTRIGTFGHPAFGGCSGIKTAGPKGGEYNLEYSWRENIPGNAFHGFSSLTSIELPKGITSIGVSAFSDCSSLTSIELPEGLTSIGFDAFSDCSSLTSIDIPEGVTSIGDRAFTGCGSLKSIELSKGITSIGVSAFSHCSSLTSIELPEGITSIGSNTFYNCSSLTSIDIPEGVTSIGGSAFSGCSGLTSIELPEGITSIGSNTFYNCSSLTSIRIPESLTSIGSEAFAGCVEIRTAGPIGKEYDLQFGWKNSIPSKVFCKFENLTSIELPEGLTSIRSEAFYDCSSLTNIDIPECVTSVGSKAFYNCSSLTSIDIPEGVTSIGDNAFYGCSSLTSIKIPESLTSIGNNVFRGCSEIKTAGPKGGEYNIEYGWRKNIPASAFYAISGLTSIDIPEGVTSIGSKAFYNCSSLTSIRIPESLTSIGSEAFAGCSEIKTAGPIGGDYNLQFGWKNKIPASMFNRFAGLTSIELPEGLTSIGSNVFYGCTNLSEVYIPYSIKTISAQVFYNCSSLTDIYYGSTAEKWGLINISAESGIPENVEIHYSDAYSEGVCGDDVTWMLDNKGCLILSGTGEMYDFEADSVPWKTIIRSIKTVKLSDGISYIGANSFNGLYNLTSVELSDSVENIGDCAFSGCDKLAQIVFGQGTCEFGSEVFKDCSNLITVGPTGGDYNIQYSWTGSIPENAFRGNSIIQSVVISENITSIGNGAFSDCAGLSSLGPVGGDYDIQYAWKDKIPNNAFEDNNSLTQVTLSEDLVEVGEEAFKNCINLSSVIIPSNVSTVGNSVFKGCTKLKTAGPVGGDYDIQYGWEGIIPDNAFNNNDNLETIAFVESITGLGNNAFMGCVSLKAISLPISLHSIGEDAFKECPSLTTAGPIGGEYDVQISFGEERTESLRDILNAIPSVIHVTCPNDIESIDDSWFSGVTTVKTVVLSDNLPKISSSTFMGCTGLTDVYIPYSVKKIEDNAFENCVGLRDVYYEYTEAYWNRVIKGSGNIALSSATVHFGDSPAGSCGLNTTWVLDDDQCLTISGTGAMTDYDQGNAPWDRVKNDIKRMTIEDGIEHISNNAFCECSVLEEVTIYGSVNSIGENAFEGCNKLKDITYYGSAAVWNSMNSVIPSTTTVHIRYNISFDGNGDENDYDEQMVEYGQPYGQLPVPDKRTGYVFEGWTLTKDAEDFVTNTSVVEEDYEHTLFAKWRLYASIVTLDAGEGHTDTPEMYVEYGKAFGELPEAVRAGYSFDGWFTETEDGDKVEPTTILEKEEDLTLYAHWTVCSYIVSFDTNGGEPIDDTLEIEFGSEYGALPVPQPREYYTFTGWYESDDSNVEITESTALSIPNDHTLVAHWLGDKRTISFVTGTDEQIDNVERRYGQNYGDLPSPNSNDDRMFVGWFTSPKHGELITDTAKILTKGDITLYAGWSTVSVESVCLKERTVHINIDESLKIDAVVSPTDATIKDLIWRSDDESIVCIKDGVITGISEGEASVIVTTADGGYTDTCSVVVTPSDVMRDEEIDSSSDSFKTPEGLWLTGFKESVVYTGSKITQDPKVYYKGTLLREGSEYKITYNKNTTVGTAMMTVTGKGNYKGKIVKEFRITSGDLSDAYVSIKPDVYNGKAKTPKVTITYCGKTLKNNKDYTLIYPAPIYGKADEDTDYTVKVYPKAGGNFTGETEGMFTIYKKGTKVSATTGCKALKGSTVTIENAPYKDQYTYTGVAITPAVTVRYPAKQGGGVVPADAYNVTYSKNVNKGTAVITVTGIESKGVTGTLTKKFSIVQCGMEDTSKVNIFVDKNVPMVKGGAKPVPIITYQYNSDSPVITLREGIDYKLTYSNNKSTVTKKTPSVKIKGAGNFKGSRTMEFKIGRQDVANLNVIVADKQMSTGKGGTNYKSAPKVYDMDGTLLKEKTDYTVKYLMDSTGGEITSIYNGMVIRAVVTGTGTNYTGTQSVRYKIRTLKDIGKAKVAAIPAQAYTGSPVTIQNLTLTDSSTGATLELDKDYEIVGYYNNIKKGNASIIIRGVGDYSGVKTVKFKIGATDYASIWKGSWSLDKGFILK